MIPFIIQLLIAHFIGDFVLQPTKWIQDRNIKKIKSGYLYLHILVHAVLLLIVLKFNQSYFPGIVFIAITHYLIDLSKSYLTKTVNTRKLFFLDQSAHLAILLLVANYYFRHPIELFEINENNVLLLILGLVLTGPVASIVIGILTSKWDLNTIKGNDQTLTDAGKYIGILERLFVFLFIITGHWDGIGFLLAAKSVFRFGDLSNANDRKLTEYILIGTLLSFAIASLIGLSYNYVHQIIN